MTDDVTDEGDRDLCFSEELFEGCIFKIVCRLLSSLLILFDTSENLVDCFFGPRQGDTGTVTARFDTFGTPTCPAWYLLLAEDGIGRALNWVETPIVSICLLRIKVAEIITLVEELCSPLFPLLLRRRLFEALVLWVLHEVFPLLLDFEAIPFFVVIDPVPDKVIFLSIILLLTVSPPFFRREPNNGEKGVVVGLFSTFGTPTPPKPTLFFHNSNETRSE